jgi:hypothetical protein
VAGACADPGERDFSELYDQATPLQATSTTRGCMFSRDKDMFSVTAPVGQDSLIQLSLIGDSRLAPKVLAYDANRKRFAYIHGKRNEQVSGWMLVQQGTTVYLEVTQVHSDEDAYTLTLTAAPLNDPFEPNNISDLAKPIALGTPHKAFLASAANEDSHHDWYSVQVTEAGVLRADVDMSQDVATRVRIFDSNRKRVAYESGSRGERVQTEAKVVPGIYYIQLDSVHGLKHGNEGQLPQMVTRPYVLTVQQ